MMLDIVVCVCSRGVVHSRVVEAIDRNLYGNQYHWRRIWEHDKPIPDAQNAIVARALNMEPEFVWMVEEDVEPPPNALSHMLLLARDFPVVAMPYKMSGGLWAYKKNDRNELVWAGTGCLLVKSGVFDLIGSPYFRSDVLFAYDDLKGALTDSYTEPGQYGKHDIYFFAQLAKHQIQSVLADQSCKHWKVAEWGKPNSNQGCHRIVEV